MKKKGKFLKEFNKAFAKNDTDFIIKNVTDDIQWTVTGDVTVMGKEDFMQALKQMESDEPYEIDIKNIITHGDSASVNGEMKSADGKIYAFCDVYSFKDSLIKEMTSYVIELKEN